MTLVPVPVQSTHILPWQETVQQAQMLVRSGMLPTSVKTPEAALAIILKARELGVGPMEGFEGISVIQGKPTVSPRLQLALIHRSGLLEKLDIQETADGCTVLMARRGGASFSTRFTLDDARRAGLLGNDNWKKYPANMCRWRAVGSTSCSSSPTVRMSREVSGICVVSKSASSTSAKPRRRSASKVACLPNQGAQVDHQLGAVDLVGAVGRERPGELLRGREQL